VGITFQIDPEVAPEELETGRKLFAGPCDFVKGVVAMADGHGEIVPDVDTNLHPVVDGGNDNLDRWDPLMPSPVHRDLS